MIDEQKCYKPNLKPKVKEVTTTHSVKVVQGQIMRVGNLKDGVSDLDKVLSKISIKGKWGLALNRKLNYVLVELLPLDAYRQMSFERLEEALRLCVHLQARIDVGGAVLESDSLLRKVSDGLREKFRHLHCVFSWEEYSSDEDTQWALDILLRRMSEVSKPVFLRTDGSMLCLWEAVINSYYK